ncbi:uncharacterized protein IL334_002254 [Kwoniella shivajii]|uniref:BTB domain-containing protein n=1 Tax=Kwoniella shivajii TaxID=564305 RepID=A0ABZ1CUH9_9TREE|nr:hypothetical protein IL334_002254 [Kwoniella shivajii]
MLTAYTDNDGKEYKYYDEYKDESGDLVIITSDDLAIKVQKSLLEHSSPVFRSMFSTCKSDDNVIHLDHPAAALALYLTALGDRPLDYLNNEYDTFAEAIELCFLYDTLHTGPKMLKTLSPIGKLGHKHGYSLFKFSARFDDVLTACRIIQTIGLYQDTRLNGGDAFWRPNNWERSYMDVLPSSWVWAYMQAHQQTTARIRTRDYWNDIAIKFLEYLLPVGVLTWHELQTFYRGNPLETKLT